MPRGRKFTEEDKIKQVENLQKAREEKRELRSAKLVIGDYSIFRWDELNWVVEKDGYPGYFSSLENALLSLPKKLINQLKYKEVADLLQSIKDLNKTIKDFLYLHKKEIAENT